MLALIDGDILRYEIGFAAEAGWRAVTEGREEIPPFDYVKDILLARLAVIVDATKADEGYKLYLTEGKTFRFDIAKKKPYKGTRPEKKPWHYNNLSVYMKDVLDAEVVTRIEADDALTIDHVASNGTTTLCSRDKDLRQVPGIFYSWELGLQPEFGPVDISKAGSLKLSLDKKKLIGTGLAFFCAQTLVGDPVDNIPGLPKCGPVAAFNALSEHEDDVDGLLSAVELMYEEKYSGDWEEELLEQGRLCWMTRRLLPDNSPELWRLGQSE